MGRFLSVLVILMLVFTLVSCANKDYEIHADISDTKELVKIYTTPHYDVFIYNVNVIILTGGREMTLQEALQEGSVTMKQIISDADKKIEPFIYLDGGSREYHFTDYTMFLSFSVWDGDKYPDAVYFLPGNMGMSDLKKLKLY